MTENGSTVVEQRIYGLHAVAAALHYEPEQVQELWIERQRRDGRIQALLDTAATHRTPVRLIERAELDGYESQLKSMTGGHGSYSVELSHYDPVPGDIQQKLQAAYKKQQQEG